MNVRSVAHSLLKTLTGTKCINGIVQSVPFHITDLHNRRIHQSIPYFAAHFKHRDRPDLLKTVRKPDEGVDELISLNASIVSKQDMFTDDKTPDLLFNGVPFNKIPICHVCVTKNNCKFRINDADNGYIIYRSNGMEGFKKCRKGTNVAAQTTALTIGNKAMAMGVRDIRVKIQGLGPGRGAAIKGLQMSGLNIISLTDDTRISWQPTARPRKARRL